MVTVPLQKNISDLGTQQVRGVAREGTDSAGGALIASGNSHVFCNGDLAIVLGDPVTPHPPGGIHNAAVMVEAATTVFINGIPVCGLDNKAQCGHPVKPGSDNVFLV